jgi:hypothetical protein
LYRYTSDPAQEVDPLGLKIRFTGDEETQLALKEAYGILNGTEHGKEMIEKMLASEKEYIVTGARPSDGATCYDGSEFKTYLDVKK